MKVFVRPFLPYSTVGLEQLLGEIGNDVDHLVQIGGARIPEHGVADDMSQEGTDPHTFFSYRLLKVAKLVGPSRLVLA